MSTLHPRGPPLHSPDRHRRAPGVSRDPFFDNAKIVLVTLVVIGHSWTLLPDVSTSSPVYVFLYTFHVPAFVLVTGYLSRSFTFSRANLRKLITTIVVPYLVFETLLALFRTAVGHEASARSTSARTGRCGTSPCCSAGASRPRCSTGVPHPLVLAVVICLLGG